MPYDIPRITRELQQEFRLFRPGGKAASPDAPGPANRATPENMAILLAALADLTDQLEQRREALGQWTADAAVIHWDNDFARWQKRLDDYIFEVSKAPPGDRRDILWSTTAPLLLGFFGGPDSKLPQQRIDAVTPFILANQLDVDEEWRDARWTQLWDDIKQNAADIAKPVGLSLGGVLLGGGILYLIARAVTR